MLQVELFLRLGDFTLDVDFGVGAGITGLFGPSGAGKSTVLHAIAGIERPQRGRVRLGDSILYDKTQRIWVPPYRRGIGVVFQDDRLFSHYSVAGNLRYGRRRAAAGAPLGFDDVVDLLDLRPRLDQRINTLSGGERQRVALGRALLSHPALILCDEPLASLDAARRRQILPFIRRINEATGIPILYVTHDLSELLQLTDRIVLLHGGRVAGVGTYGELLHQTTVFDTMHDLGLTNVLHLTVVEHDAHAGLTQLRLADGVTLAAALHDAPIGAQLHVAVRPADVALALRPVEATSIQNRLSGHITRVTLHPTRAIVEVDVGRPLRIEVSLKTVQDLSLAPDQRVWCLIKSNAVAYLNSV